MNKTIILVILLLSISLVSEAGPSLPARIGGSVTVDGLELTREASVGFVFSVTGKDGKGFAPPAEDRDGLNKRGKYIIDIPIYDPAGQPEGARPGSAATIHVFFKGVELRVVKPFRGEFVVGKGGTITPVDLVVIHKNK